jgi:hypothetical protein
MEWHYSDLRLYPIDRATDLCHRVGLGCLFMSFYGLFWISASQWPMKLAHLIYVSWWWTPTFPAVDRFHSAFVSVATDVNAPSSPGAGAGIDSHTQFRRKTTSHHRVSPVGRFLTVRSSSLLRAVIAFSLIRYSRHSVCLPPG